MIKEKMLSVVDRDLLKKEIVLQKECSIPREEMLTLTFEDIDATDAELTGGKGSSLCILNCVRGVNVPYFFCVTTNAFKQMVRNNNILPFVEALEETSELWRKSSDEEKPKIEKRFIEAIKNLREQIVSTEMPERMKESISDAYFMLCDKTEHARNHLSVAVRSSATTEDRIDASFAGMHDTYLNQRGIDHVLFSIKRCWASVFTYRASKYRMTKNISHLDAHVSVVIQKMCFPKVAGTSFTIEIGTSYPGIHIAACYGLGEALVSGEVTSDEWLLNSDNMLLIKRVCGSKRIQYQILEGSSGIQKIETPISSKKIDENVFTDAVKKKEEEKEEQEQENDYSLDNEMVQKIANVTKRIGKVYQQLFGYKYVDTEFAMSKTPTLYLLQCRPVVPVIWSKIMTVRSDTPDLWQKVILKGKYSLLGSVHGKAKVITDFQDLIDGNTSIEADDILITYKTSNYWNQYLTNLKGIVTMEGSPTAHPMLIGRERKIPCVIGCDNVIELMKPYQGKWITLDGVKKCLFVGKVPLKEISADELLKQQFEVVNKEPLDEDESSRKFLVSIGRAKYFNDKLWVANKLYKLCPITKEWTKQSYKIRENLIIDSCSNNPELMESKKKELSKILCHEVMESESLIYDKYQPLAQTIQVFTGMGINECEKLHQDYINCSEMIAELGDKFDCTVSSWDVFGDVFRSLIAHMWISFFFRVYVDQNVQAYSERLRVSKFHLEQFQHQIQSQEVEEDNVFRSAILDLSLLFIDFLKKKNDGKFDETILSNVTLEMIQEDVDILSKFETLSKCFKITSISDFYQEVPIQACFMKVKGSIKEFFDSGDEPEEKIKHLLGLNNEEKKIQLEKYYKEMEYFVEEEEYCRWVKLGIQARIQHCNAHHYRFRSQWNVKERLKEAFLKMEKTEKKWYEFSHQEISEVIKLFRIKE